MHLLATACVAIALPLSVAGSTRLARGSLPDATRVERATVAIAFCLGFFLVCTALLGRALRTFDAGLVGWALASIVLFIITRRNLANIPPSTPAPRRGVITAFVTSACVVTFFAWIAVRYQMHDEHAISGHGALISELARNVYPPHYPPFPRAEAQYHYGYDILAGALARALGTTLDLSIDLVMLALLVFLSLAAAAIAHLVDARASWSLAIVAVHFGAGLAFPLLLGADGRHSRCLAQYHHPTCGVELFPTQFINLFQHPVAIGVPMFLSYVLVAPTLAGLGRASLVPFRERRWWVAACVGIVILAGLSLGQVVYFALGTLAAFATLPIGWMRAERRPSLARGFLALVFVSASALALAFAMGGMFSRAPIYATGLVGWRSPIGFPEGRSLLEIAWHHVVNLGLPFLALPAVAAVAWKTRNTTVVTLLAFAVGGILVPHLFAYARSWDIIKFPCAAAFALSLLYVVAIDPQIPRGAFPWSGIRGLGFLLVIGTGLTAARAVAFPPEGDHRLYSEDTFRPDPPVEKCIEWFLANDYRSEDLVYAQSNIAQMLYVFGGLSVPGEDADIWYNGVKKEILDRQRALMDRIKRSMAIDALGELGVRFVVISDEEMNNLGDEARRTLERAAPPLELVHTEPGDGPGRRRRIWRVSDARTEGREATNR